MEQSHFLLRASQQNQSLQPRLGLAPVSKAGRPFRLVQAAVSGVKQFAILYLCCAGRSGLGGVWRSYFSEVVFVGGDQIRFTFIGAWTWSLKPVQ
jgi:hypothetical protein